MFTFLISIALLITGYFTYGKYLEKVIGIDINRPTPAKSLADGIDYKEMKTWRVYVIQFLNIAGLGPIFGAIMGAAYGPIAYLWIVLGCVFMGAAFDYTVGMLSVQNDGKSLNWIIGKYLGKNIAKVMVILLSWLLLAAGSSFVIGPAALLQNITGWDFKIWLYIIFAYYMCATLLPIDKIIGKIYPFFGAILILMAIFIIFMLIYNWYSGEVQLIELTPSTFKNYKSNANEYMLIPMLFIVISCGAISGFHATQSPMMARCIGNESHGRKIFYGAMITEGIIACIWATAAMALFNGPEGLNAAADGTLTDSSSMLSAKGNLIALEGKRMDPASIANTICISWFGKFGAILTLLGIVICPITSGDTAFRSMRLIVADAFKYPQKSIKNRIIVSIPLFLIAYALCNIQFDIIWTYLGIGNQLIAAISLWACSVYFVISHKNHWLMSIPATFITYICTCYFLIAPNANGGLNLQPIIGYIAGGVVAAIILTLFLVYTQNRRKRTPL
jgi:carbon starvation protein CstA